MFKLSGEKLDWFSGMASATSTISFRVPLISRSTVEATVGGDGDPAPYLWTPVLTIHV